MSIAYYPLNYTYINKIETAVMGCFISAFGIYERIRI